MVMDSTRRVAQLPDRTLTMTIDGKPWSAKPKDVDGLAAGHLTETWRVWLKPTGQDASVSIFLLTFPAFSGRDTTFHIEGFKENSGAQLAIGKGMPYTSMSLDLHAWITRMEGKEIAHGTFSGTFGELTGTGATIAITDGAWSFPTGRSAETIEADTVKLNRISAELDGVPWSGAIATSSESFGSVDGRQVWDVQVLFQVDAAQKDGMVAFLLDFPFVQGNDTTYRLPRWTEAFGLQFTKTTQGRAQVFRNQVLDVRLVKRRHESLVKDAQGKDRVEQQVQMEASFSGNMICPASGRTMKIANGRYLGNWLRVNPNSRAGLNTGAFVSHETDLEN